MITIIIVTTINSCDEVVETDIQPENIELEKSQLKGTLWRSAQDEGSESAIILYFSLITGDVQLAIDNDLNSTNFSENLPDLLMKAGVDDYYLNGLDLVIHSSFPSEGEVFNGKFEKSSEANLTDSRLNLNVFGETREFVLEAYVMEVKGNK